MVFDEDLSTKVSLPRILDHFVASGENPDIIFAFLELHKDKIDDILKYSDCSPRILSLDFIRKLSVEQNEKFVRLLIEIKELNYEVLCLTWQIILSKTLDKTTRNIYNTATKRNGSLCPNPFHHGKIGGEILEYDRRFLELEDAVEYSVAMNEFKPEEVEKYVKNMDMSVILPRMFQEDIFCMLDPIKQFILINILPRYRDFPVSVLKGIKQMVCGGMSAEIKIEICKSLENRASSSPNLDELLNGQIEDIRDPIDGFETKKTFNQIAMKLELKGKDRYCDWILFYLLFYRGLNFMKGCSNGHRRLFEKYFDILEIMDNGKNVVSSPSDS
jgi:hypothetical protein